MSAFGLDWPRLGMPTLLETGSIEKDAALCRELGLGFIEISMDLPAYQPERLDVGVLARAAERRGVYYTFHLNGGLDPCVFDERVSAAWTETALRTIAIAKALGSPVLNMHLKRGDYFTLPDGKVCLYDVYKDEYLRKMADFRDRCEAAVNGADITITIENADDFEAFPFLTDGLDALLRSPVFGLCFDIGHNAAADYTHEPVIMARESRLRHFHVHDAKGRQNHMPLGSGETDLKKYIGIAEKNNCRAVVEVKTAAGLRGSVEWLSASFI